MIFTRSGQIVGRQPVPDFMTGVGSTLKDGMDAVAVLGGIGDWAAYANYRDQTDEEIYGHGHKLTQYEASLLFPYLNREAYRL